MFRLEVNVTANQYKNSSINHSYRSQSFLITITHSYLLFALQCPQARSILYYSPCFSCPYFNFSQKSFFEEFSHEDRHIATLADAGWCHHPLKRQNLMFLGQNAGSKNKVYKNPFGLKCLVLVTFS